MTNVILLKIVHGIQIAKKLCPTDFFVTNAYWMITTKSPQSTQRTLAVHSIETTQKKLVMWENSYDRNLPPTILFGRKYHVHTFFTFPHM